jgi:hypothetical protein
VAGAASAGSVPAGLRRVGRDLRRLGGGVGRVVLVGLGGERVVLRAGDPEQVVEVVAGGRRLVVHARSVVADAGDRLGRADRIDVLGSAGGAGRDGGLGGGGLRVIVGGHDVLGDAVRTGCGFGDAREVVGGDERLVGVGGVVGHGYPRVLMTASRIT